MAEDDSNLLSTAAAARALGVDRATLSRWASTGVVEPTKRTIGGHMRWDLTDLRKQITQRGAKA